MIESSVTSRGQTTLPKVVRESLGLSAGDKVRYVICGQEVRILPVRPISRLFGMLKYRGPVVTIDEMERAAARGASEE